MPNPNNLLSRDGDVRFYPEFFDKVESDYYFEKLINEITWKQEPIIIFGRKVMQPRITAWYGDDGRNYSYSGITMTPRAWTGFLSEIKKRVEWVSGVKFNSALLNQYRNENDSVGWHRDNEKELGTNPIIGSVSFGFTREFQFRHHSQKTLKTSVSLSHGSVLIMKGDTQHHWLHSIPKNKGPAGARVNITFRVII